MCSCIICRMCQFPLPLVTRHETQVQLTSCTVVTRLPTCCRSFHNPNQWERAEDTELFYSSTSCFLRSKYSSAYSHLSSENDWSSMITILVFRKSGANDSLRLVVKFHKQCKYPQDWKTTNYFYIYKTIASVCVPVV